MDVWGGDVCRRPRPFRGLVSLPVSQEWRAPENHQRFSVGVGTIVILSH